MKREEMQEMRQNTPCKFYHSCPSASGWCRIRQPDASCVPFLISAYNGLRAAEQEKNGLTNRKKDDNLKENKHEV